MQYKLKNLVWFLITLLYILTALSVSGCASGPMVSVSAYTMDSTYQRDCVGPNAPFRPTDRECRQRFEPHTQSNQVQRVTSPEKMEQWQRDIHQRQQCRRTGRGWPEGLK